MMMRFSQNLNARDRHLLMIAVPVVLVLLILLGARNLISQRAHVKEHLGRTLEDIAWLQAQSRFVTGVGASCPAAPWNTSSIAALAGRHSVNLAAVPQFQNGELRLDIDLSQGNRVVDLIKALSCQGGRINEFDLRTVDNQGMVRGSLVLLAPVT